MEQSTRPSGRPYFVEPALGPLIFTILNPLRLPSPYTRLELRAASTALAEQVVARFARFGVGARDCCFAMGLREVPLHVESPEAVTALSKIFELMHRSVDSRVAMGGDHDEL